jgi:putative intracellular protease/amidase
VLFAGFELLDVFGPVELLSRFPQDISVVMVGPRAGAVRSSQGTEVIATVGYDDAPAPDIVMVPGGLGTRALAADKTFLEWLRRWASDADLVTSVCTGSALLAAAGLLDGYRATSNKRAFPGLRVTAPTWSGWRPPGGCMIGTAGLRLVSRPGWT